MRNEGQHAIRLFQTLEHACGYWPERRARDLIIDPADPHLPGVYAQAMAMGFRRSGGHVYRPHCAGCRACVSVRIPVRDFQPNRAQRRCLARNADLEVRIVAAEQTDEQFALYHRYLTHRHALCAVKDLGRTRGMGLRISQQFGTDHGEPRPRPRPAHRG